VVAHQSSTIRNAAGIAVVKDGMTVEQGKHDELMVNEGRDHTLHS
jgi:ABC-type multidrug transport system fused ATPase/permease subunit